ncbi:DUF333 domain-containing protein [Phyllobacterium sp. TAF24]|uniref:putative hemolysin n=1 Tax=Phyllobacterium sp. TAF24 TaxID=3233068 RepID=UPI003F9720E3
MIWKLKNMTNKVVSAIAFTVFALSACTANEEDIQPRSVGLANPASVYCQSLGGTLLAVFTKDGSSNDCILPNGRRIDEWKLFRQNHK